MSSPTPIILAGGSGTRMWPISTNKLLLPFLGEPFLARVVREVVKSLGVRPVLIVSPSLEKEIRSLNWAKGCHLVVQPESLGMGEAVLRASERVKKGPALIINGNDFLDADFIADFVKRCQSFEGGGLPAVRVSQYFPGGYLKVDQERVLAVVEKPGEGREPSNLVKPVLDYFHQLEVFVALIKKEAEKKTETDDLYERALTTLLTQTKFGWVELKRSWRSLKYPWDVLEMMSLILSQETVDSEFQPSLPVGAVIEGPVFFEPGVKVFEGAKIKGPAYLGRGVIVGNNALIRDSMIGAGSVVGFGTEIARSWVGQGCWFHSNYLGDSVVGDGCSFGAGASTANLRLDEEAVFSLVKGKRVSTQRQKMGAMIGSNSKFGAGVILMPGVKVGSDCQVGPGVILKEDLADLKGCFMKQELKVVANQRAAKTDRANFRKEIK